MNSTLRLGIDATCVFPRQSAGIEHLCYGVIPHMLAALGASRLAVGIPRGTLQEYVTWCGAPPGTFLEVGTARPTQSGANRLGRERSIGAIRNPGTKIQAGARRARSLTAAVQKSREFYRRFAPDVVLYPFHRVPVVADTSVLILHDLRVFTDLADAGGGWDRAIISWNVRRSRRLITSWPHPRTHAQRLFGPTVAGKLSIVPFPPTTHTGTELQLGGQPSAGHGTRVLYPASTAPHKNHSTLVEAVAIARQQYGLSIQLDLPGPLMAPISHRLQEQIRALGLQRQVRLLGFVSAARMADLYRACDIVAVPSLWEAASGAVFDAVAHEKPLLCADVEPIREQLSLIGIRPKLVPPTDPLLWAQALRGMVVSGSPTFVPNYDTNRAHKFLNGLTWEKTASEYLRVCQQAARPFASS